MIGKPPTEDLSTVLITNGNLLSMASLGDWLCEYGHCLKAVVITTKLPSTKSNVSGLGHMFMQSGLDYTYFKLNTNRFLPLQFQMRGLPMTIQGLLRRYRLPTEVIFTKNVNDPDVIDRIRSLSPSILLSFSATSRFSRELISVPARVAINVHYALLPEYAGLSPYYWYVHHREQVSGITSHVIHPKLDAGPIIRQDRFDSSGITSVMDLLNRQMELVSPMLCDFYAGKISERDAQPQDLSKRTYYRHPTRAQVQDFNSRGLVFGRAKDYAHLAEVARRLGTQIPAVLKGASVGTAPRVSPIVAEEAARVRDEWYVPEGRPPASGWLVYSLDFVLATLQGCITEPERIRRTAMWLGIATIVRILMAIMQILIMTLAWIPVISWFVEMLARTFTRNAAGFFFRSCYWKSRLLHLGTDTIIDQGVEIWGPGHVSIGSHCHVDTNVRLAAGERRHRQHGFIHIGNYVHLGPGVHIAGRGGVIIRDFVGVMANAHLYSATGVIEGPDDPGQLMSMSHMAPQDQQHIIERPIVIDEYAFIGMMSRILPGVRVGYGAVVHANCELTGDVPAFANMGGIPRGRQIGWRRPRRRSTKLSPNGRHPLPYLELARNGHVHVDEVQSARGPGEP